MKRIIRFFVILLGLAGAGYAGWYFFLQPKPFVAPATTAVTRGDIQINVIATGTLNASTVVSVGAEVSGKIDVLHVELGQEVKKGDLIAEIDPLDKENALKIANVALQNNQAKRRIQEATTHQAELTAKRADQLKAQNLMSDSDYEEAKLSLETAQAQLDVIDAEITSAELSVESARLALSRTRITAPMDGTVVGLPVEAGQTINASSSSPTIAKLADLSTMTVQASISEADVPKVTSGQRAYFTILGDPDTPIDATLLTVEPAPESFQTSVSNDASASSGSAVYYNGVLSVPNVEGKLKIAMTAQVTIVTNEVSNVLVVPASALSKRQNGETEVMIYDAKTQTIQPRRVVTGLDNSILVEIKDGLSEGEKVVTNGGGSASTSTKTGRPGGGPIGGGPGGRPPG